MNDDDIPKRSKRNLSKLLMTLFLRLVALGCLWFALNIWSQLVGYGAQGSMRFDLLSSDMKAATASLALLYPVAAIGLWLKGSWGPVIWTLAAAVEIFMFQSFPDIYGAEISRLLLIAVTVLTYAGLRVSLWLNKRHSGTGERATG